MSLSADVDVDPSVDLLGKSITDLQTGISVDNSTGKITGTLKYISDYTGFSGDPELQSGNFLCMHFTTTEDATTTIQVLGGDFPPAVLDPSDNIAIFRVKNRDQSIQVVSTKDGATTSKVYTLRSLNFNRS